MICYLWKFWELESNIYAKFAKFGDMGIVKMAFDRITDNRMTKMVINFFECCVKLN